MESSRIEINTFNYYGAFFMQVSIWNFLFDEFGTFVFPLFSKFLFIPHHTHNNPPHTPPPPPHTLHSHPKKIQPFLFPILSFHLINSTSVWYQTRFHSFYHTLFKNMTVPPPQKKEKGYKNSNKKARNQWIRIITMHNQHPKVIVYCPYRIIFI